MAHLRIMPALDAVSAHNAEPRTNRSSTARCGVSGLSHRGCMCASRVDHDTIKGITHNMGYVGLQRRIHTKPQGHAMPKCAMNTFFISDLNGSIHSAVPHGNAHNAAPGCKLNSDLVRARGLPHPKRRRYVRPSVVYSLLRSLLPSPARVAVRSGRRRCVSS